jgi:hypothetical protein
MPTVLALTPCSGMTHAYSISTNAMFWYDTCLQYMNTLFWYDRNLQYMHLHKVTMFWCDRDLECIHKSNVLVRHRPTVYAPAYVLVRQTPTVYATTYVLVRHRPRVYAPAYVLVQRPRVNSFIHLAVCLTTGPKPLPKRALHIVRSRVSSFKWEYSLLSLRSSSSFLRLLPCLPVTSIPSCIFLSITRCRRQFLRKMWKYTNKMFWYDTGLQYMHQLMFWYDRHLQYMQQRMFWYDKGLQYMHQLMFWYKYIE